nr:unnamed protein product [Callosobruchus chinensis]
MNDSETEHDIRMLLKYCKVCAFFGITPGNLDKKPGRMLASHVAFIARATVITSMWTLGVYARIYGVPFKPHYKLINITSCIQKVVEYIFILCSFTLAITRSHLWNKLFDDLKALRVALRHAGYKQTFINDTKLCILKILSPIVLYIFFNFWDAYFYSAYLTMSIPFRIFTFYQFLITVLLNRMLMILKRRYRFLVKILHQTVNLEEERAMIDAVQLLKVLLRRCYFVVDAFNQIFGWIIFFSLITCSLNMLGSFMFVLENKFMHSLYSSNDIICFVSYCGIYLILTVSIIISCDSTEKEGEKLTNLCHATYVEQSNGYLKNEFKRLAVISEKLGPKFSAAGFCTVNKTTLIKFLSALTSYAIICIQLIAL